MIGSSGTYVRGAAPVAHARQCLATIESRLAGAGAGGKLAQEAGETGLGHTVVTRLIGFQRGHDFRFRNLGASDACSPIFHLLPGDGWCFVTLLMRAPLFSS